VFEDALLAAGEHTRYVLLDKADNHMDLLRANRHIEITHGAYLGRGPWRQFMRERLSGLTGHVHFVHTKYLLVDPLTDDPLVITGSANFSPASTSQNDENMLLISGDTRVADVYLTEFMRTFTHLRFRASLDLDEDQRGPDPRAGRTTAKLLLRPDDSWSEEYFADGPKRRERVLFR
jgi:phosphatidylserine/phosphatidylglycerophosphate/cardiolipin synthase-like enzyme